MPYTAKCEKQIDFDFCPKCGNRLRRETMFCTNCGKELHYGSKFCAYCGTRVIATSGTSAPVTPQRAYTAPVQSAAPPVYDQPAGSYAAPPVYGQPADAYAYGGDHGYGQNYEQPAGRMIMDAGKVVVYNGTKAIGITYGDGTLYVYDDRLEFHKKHGTMAGMGVNPVVGMAVSAASAKKNPVDTWYYRDMSEVYTAKHAGVISKICIKFHSGKGFSITLSGRGNSTNSMVEELCAMINQYL